MLQQTTVKAVGAVFRALPRALAGRAMRSRRRRSTTCCGLGRARLLRARPQPACLRAARSRRGTAAFPGDRGRTARAARHRRLHGGGDRGDCVRCAARCAVDGNVERVVTRLFAVERELPAAKPEIRALAQALVPAARSRRLRAGADGSRRHDLHAEEAGLRALPVDGRRARRARAAIRRRFRARRRSGKASCGAARRSWCGAPTACVLVRTRPPKGLLGGMTEVPTTEWTHDFDDDAALDEAPRLARARPKWRRLPGVVTHVFTHFPLELTVYAARGRRRDAGARRRALGAARDACRRGAAQRHAQGAGARGA